MNCALWLQFTAEQSEGFNPDRRRRKIAMIVQPLREAGANVSTTAGERHVRMKRAGIKVDADGEDRVIHALTQLKQPRMPGADADPNHSRWPVRWKRAYSLDRQDERFNFDGRQPRQQGFDLLFGDVTEEAERQMPLLRT